MDVSGHFIKSTLSLMFHLGGFMGMVISSIASSAVNGATLWQQQKSNYSQLASALKSGNLSAAQQAFATMQASTTSQAYSTQGAGHHHLN